MSAIYIPRRRVTQPQTAVELDLGSPFAAGIVEGYNAGPGARTFTGKSLSGSPGVDLSIRADQNLHVQTTGTSANAIHFGGDITNNGGRDKTTLVVARMLALPASGVDACVAGFANSEHTVSQWFGVIGVTPAGQLRFQDYDGSLRYGNCGTPVTVGQWFCAAGAGRSSSSVRGARDGVLGASTSVGALNAFGTFGLKANFQDQYGPFGVQYGSAQIALVIGWDRALSDMELAEVTRNPWQIFRPRFNRIYSLPAAGGGVSGTLAATEAGADVFAASGTLGRSGALAATEAGADAFAASGTVSVSGTLAATEAGADAFAAAGAVDVSGTIAATEVGADVFAGSGASTVSGTLTATEAGADSFAAAGSVDVAGAMSAAESGADAFAASGAVDVAGALAATETGADVFSGLGGNVVSGALSATEAGADAFAAAGAVDVSGTLAATEAGADAFSASGAVDVAGAMAATEAGADTFAAAGTLGAADVSGVFAAIEAGADAIVVSGAVQVSGAMAATEAGEDVFSSSAGFARLAARIGDFRNTQRVRRPPNKQPEIIQ